MFHAFCETFITTNYQIMKDLDLARFGVLNRRCNTDFLLPLCFQRYFNVYSDRLFLYGAFFSLAQSIFFVFLAAGCLFFNLENYFFIEFLRFRDGFIVTRQSKCILILPCSACQDSFALSAVVYRGLRQSRSFA